MQKDAEDWFRLVEERVRPVERREKDSAARKVCDEVFDHATLLTIYKLICDGVLKTIDFPISTGKEGNVFKGTGKDGDVAVKIYRVSNLSFKSISKYIIGDPRFNGIANNRRKLINQWTQKEFRNLERMHSSGVRVPKPIAYMNNVLVMEYICTPNGPAPILKNSPPKDIEESGRWVLDNLTACYNKAHIVHGDVSEFNILQAGNDEKDELIIIDVSQGVPLKHPMSRELIQRDVENIVRYFNKLGTHFNAEAELMEITAHSDNELGE